MYVIFLISYNKVLLKTFITLRRFISLVQVQWHPSNLCYLALDPASIPLTSQNQTINSYQLDLPEPMRPLTSKTTNIIANNGTSDFVGSLTLVKNTVVIPGILPYQLVISNGPLGGEGYAINATNVGIPYGAMIIYPAN